MPTRSLSFDDEQQEPLYVFSGNDLLMAHYDGPDLDWEEVAERVLIDERRGLIIAQVAVLEDLVDEFILYLEDPVDIDSFRRRRLNRTIGPRLEMLREGLDEAGMLDGPAIECLDAAKRTVERRNRLAHSTTACRMTRIVPISELRTTALEVEWVFVDRQSATTERVSMASLRHDLLDAIGVFSDFLVYAERFVEIAPRPTHFRGGHYLAPPTH